MPTDAIKLCDYDTYFASGLYDARYPRPNPTTQAVIDASLNGARARVLDFGCGSGRYTAALLRRPATEIVAYDICPTALATLESRLAPMIAAGRLETVGQSLDTLMHRVAERGPLDLALVLFGVLGHIRGRSERRAVLEGIRDMLAPTGRLILSVPNRKRRFRAEQQAAEPRVQAGELERGDVFYTRRTPDGTEIAMFYHLFTLEEITSELSDAGYAVERSTIESIFPEAGVVKRPAIAALDRWLRPATPIDLAYGFLLVARPLPRG